MASVPQLQVMPTPGTHSLRLAWFDSSGNLDTAYASVVIDLGDCGVAQIKVQSMPDGSKVLASPDFNPAGWRGEYSAATANYNHGDIVMVSTGGRSGFNDAQLLGTWVCVAANGTGVPTVGVQFPQWPYPSTKYWHCLSFPPQTLVNCNSGTTQSFYVNGSGTF